MTESVVANDRQTEAHRNGSAEVLRNYVGGRWIDSRASEFFNVYNPATGEVIAKTPLSTGEDLNAAVVAAKKAFPAWRDTPAVVRARSLFRFRQLLEEHFEELAEIVTREIIRDIFEIDAVVHRADGVPYVLPQSMRAVT